jgi:NAD+ synthase (glutamine-hydrolysing)
MRLVRIALAQINSTVGDLQGNLEKMLKALEEAKSQKADIILYPELSLTGYPPEDLLLKPGFIDDNLEALEQFVREVNGILAVVGYIDRKDDIYDAAAVISNRKIRGVYHKTYLPNYGVFDENRYFSAGSEQTVFQWGDVRFGVNVCEDIWYADGPVSIQAHGGAELLLNLSASPYHRGKGDVRHKMVTTRASDHGVFIAYCNAIGGQDELIFDGNSFICSPDGGLAGSAKQFSEDLIIGDIDLDDVTRFRLKNPLRRKQKDLLKKQSAALNVIEIPSPFRKQKKASREFGVKDTYDSVAEVYEALKLGVRDYVRKNGFSKVVIGLSGGIDSALVAAIAADALGKENVSGVFMPTRFSSDESYQDAKLLADNLKIDFQVLAIEDLFKDYMKVLEKPFAGKPWSIAEENIQARIRGTLLMALSNKFGSMVLTTGNKSEMSTGYATLYGDMAGGFAVIKDVPKTLVYDVCKKINEISGYDRIPANVIEKAPTAELRPNQKDTDSLPPYDVLDPILKAYVEDDKSFAEIVEMGYPRDIVKKVIRLVDTSEYKRRQAPPGIKITPRAFGKDRRMPITNRYREN